ncbi:MAG: potassium channel family protein [Christensenellales bacterium]|jgi:trk system potassium uptake protein TrkA
MKKQFIIIGLGRFGSSLATSLYAMGNEVLAVDSDVERVDHIANFVTHAVQMDVCEEENLQSLNIPEFDVGVVAISNDIESSVLSTTLLKDLGCPQVIAKAQDDLHAKVLKKVGADRVVFPERDMGVRLAHQLQSNSVMDLVELSEDYSLVESSAPEAWWNQTLGQLNLRRKYELTVAAIKRADGALLASPGADDYVYQGDLMVLIGANETFQNLEKRKLFR